MPRPQKCRFIQNMPEESYFSPTVENMELLEKVVISFDELEALRLADFQDLSHIEAAEKMGVSRATFGRILEKARRNSADALINKKKIFISGGKFCHKRDMQKKCDRTGECLSCCKTFMQQNK